MQPPPCQCRQHRALCASATLREWLARVKPPQDATGLSRSLANDLADSIAGEWEVTLRERQYRAPMSLAERAAFDALTPRQRRRQMGEGMVPLPGAQKPDQLKVSDGGTHARRAVNSRPEAICRESCDVP